MVTAPAAEPGSAIECAPTPGAAQVTPVPRVPVWPLPDESAVVVPEPSLNCHHPAGAGTVAAPGPGAGATTPPDTHAPRPHRPQPGGPGGGGPRAPRPGSPPPERRPPRRHPLDHRPPPSPSPSL